jgi:hypothetical protein
MDALDVVIQIVVGLVACFVGYFYGPFILLMDEVEEVHQHSPWPGGFVFESRRRLLSYGVGGIVIGLVLGVVTPIYLTTQGWWTVLLILLGGACFFSIGMASLTALKWAEAGIALSLAGFVAVLQYIVVGYKTTVGADPIVLKIFVIIGLLDIGCLLAMWFGEEGHLELEPFSIDFGDRGKLVVAFITAVLTLLEFFNIIFGLWEKLR